jgi:hypothetical protein
MVLTGVEIVAIGSLIAGAVSAINSTHARKKARKERRAQARTQTRTKANGKYTDSEEDDPDLEPGAVGWIAESRERARGRGAYHEESRSRSPPTWRSRSRSIPRPESRSIHVYNESRSSFGPLNRVVTDGWCRESCEDERGEISNHRLYANSRTSMGTYQLKSRYREHSRSRSRSRSGSRGRDEWGRRHKTGVRRSRSKKILQGVTGLALEGAKAIGFAHYGSDRRVPHTEHRREEFDEYQGSDRYRRREEFGGYQDSNQWRGRDW